MFQISSDLLKHLIERKWVTLWTSKDGKIDRFYLQFSGLNALIGLTSEYYGSEHLIYKNLDSEYVDAGYMTYYRQNVHLYFDPDGLFHSNWNMPGIDEAIIVALKNMEKEFTSKSETIDSEQFNQTIINDTSLNNTKPSTKSEYREYFQKLKPYIKFNKFLKLANISTSNFSYFMKDSKYDYFLSIEKLEGLYNHIETFREKVVNRIDE